MRLYDYIGQPDLTATFIPVFEGLRQQQAAVDKFQHAADSLVGPENHQLAVVDWALQQIVGWLIDIDLLFQSAVFEAGRPPSTRLQYLISEVRQFNQPEAEKENAPGSDSYAEAQSAARAKR